MLHLRTLCMALDLGYWWIVIAIWDMVWRGIAMWKSAKNDQKNWFLAVFSFETFGLLPLFYLYFAQKKKRLDIVEPEPMSLLEKLEPLSEIKEFTPVKKVEAVKKTVKKKAPVKKAPAKKKATVKKKATAKRKTTTTKKKRVVKKK